MNINIKKTINSHFRNISDFEEASEGKIKDTYYFKAGTKEYVLSLSDLKEADHRKSLDSIISHCPSITNRFIANGSHNGRYYEIVEKIPGVTIPNEHTLKQRLDNIIRSASILHNVQVKDREGYGWIKKSVGCFSSPEGFIHNMFKRDQNGFWKNWYDLFDTTFLDYKRFHTLLKRCYDLIGYWNRKYAVHGDFFRSNIILNSKGAYLIDWDNLIIGDYLYDIATLQMENQTVNIKGEFYNYYNKVGIETESYYERFICSSLIKGLDGLRFYAKFEYRESYNSTLDYLERVSD